jgi:chromosome segregation ATPase
MRNPGPPHPLHSPRRAQELRKSADQRAREAAMTQGEAAKVLREERAAFEKREGQLVEELKEARATSAAAEARAGGLQSQLSVLQAAHASLQASLESKTAAEAALTAQLAQVRPDCNQER